MSNFSLQKNENKLQIEFNPSFIIQITITILFILIISLTLQCYNNKQLSNKILHLKNKKNTSQQKITKQKSNQPQPIPENAIRLLVICANKDENHFELWKNKKLINGQPIIVEQARYEDISLTTYIEPSIKYPTTVYPMVSLSKAKYPIENSTQLKHRTFKPDYLLIRDCLKSTTNKEIQDLNVFLGFYISQIPCINSFQSIWSESERVLITSELVRMNKKYGQNKFPIIKTYYYDSWKEINWKDFYIFNNDSEIDEKIIDDYGIGNIGNNVPKQFPFVVKISNCHAGFMKILIHNNNQLNELKSILGNLDRQTYIHIQPFIEGIGDLRIQKIGNNYRVWKRISVSGDWKTNTGTPLIKELKMKNRYKFWIDQCSKCFNMDICSVDVLLSKIDGKEYILEFGGTASGFGDIDNDNITLVNMVLQKMNKHFCS